jgi:hypothetical protein
MLRDTLLLTGPDQRASQSSKLGTHRYSSKQTNKQRRASRPVSRLPFQVLPRVPTQYSNASKLNKQSRNVTLRDSSRATCTSQPLPRFSTKKTVAPLYNKRARTNPLLPTRRLHANKQNKEADTYCRTRGGLDTYVLRYASTPQPQALRPGRVRYATQLLGVRDDKVLPGVCSYSRLFIMGRCSVFIDRKTMVSSWVTM